MKRNLLRVAMHKANITPLMLANKLGVSRSRVSQILNGHELRESQIITISRYVGISINDIVYDTNPPALDQFHIETALLKHYRKLSPAAQRLLVQLLDEMSKGGT